MVPQDTVRSTTPFRLKNSDYGCWTPAYAEVRRRHGAQNAGLSKRSKAAKSINQAGANAGSENQRKAKKNLKVRQGEVEQQKGGVGAYVGGSPWG